MISERSKRAGIKELKIFDNFRVDNNLPKYKREKKIDNIKGNAFYLTNDDSNSIMVRNTNTDPTSIGVNEMDIDYNKPSFRKRFKALFCPNFFGKLIQKQKKSNNLITIRDFFINLADHFNELTPIADIADHYEKAIKQARTLGQWSLAEQLEDKLDVVRSEAHLIQMGITKYVTNEQVCDFYENIGEDKNLKLTWIEHFVKIIPNDIIGVKEKIDKRGLFDNYVILHYDPNNDATSLTKEETETKKDPILFGVIKNSKRLYYVGDWVDEYCDLTLDRMFEKLGERVLEINNRNLKTYIDKGGDYELKRKKKRKSKKSK
jgi:hypothetical protein